MDVARKEQFTGRRRILARQDRQFRCEIWEGKIDPERRWVCVEQPHRRFEIGGRSDWSDLKGGVRRGVTMSLSTFRHKGEALPMTALGRKEGSAPSRSSSGLSRYKRHRLALAAGIGGT
jgi:hypothetical protein